jgi:DNA-binding transcriptional LysR family regulator
MRRRLDSRALELFLAVAESMSFRQAAQSLHISQPPLSRAIRELEERLQTRLFERDTRAVALTAAGRRLLPRAQRILQLLQEAEAEVARHADESALRLGFTSALQPSWFQGLAERITTAKPRWSVQTVYDTSPRLVRLMRAHRLDAAFIALPTESTGLDVTEIERHPMCVALASSHDLARKRRLALADLVRVPLFWFERSRQPAFFDHCQRVFARHGFAPKTLREPSDHHVLLADVAAGRGVALLPNSLRELRRRGLVYRPLSEGDELSVGVALALPPESAELRKALLGLVRRR